jgi:ABC-type molybdate transport system permease subunit
VFTRRPRALSQRVIVPQRLLGEPLRVAALQSSLLRVDLELEPAAQRMGQRQKDFGLQVLMAKA